MYLSDFGPVSVVPNRQMARAGATVARNAFLIDPRMVSLGVFDDIQLVRSPPRLATLRSAFSSLNTPFWSTTKLPTALPRTSSA
jgi:hypothetical protein